MALLQVILPDVLSEKIDELYEKLDASTSNARSTALEAQRSASERYAVTRKVPDGYRLERTARTMRLVPLAGFPTTATITRTGLVAALLSIALDKPNLPALIAKVQATGIRRGRPRK
jgi:hypothetical protein